VASQEPAAHVVSLLLGLGARGRTSPVAILRALGAPEKLLPRPEDSCAFVVDVGASDERPVVHATFSAEELGFRFGRPRFQPAQIGGDAEIVVDVDEDGSVAFRAALRLGAGGLTVEGTLSALAITARDIDPVWIAAVTTALAGATVVRVDDGSPPTLAPFTVPRAARLGGAVTVQLRAGDPVVRGRITLATPSTAAEPEGSALVLEGALGPARRLDGTSLRGTVALTDLLTTGAFDGAVRPLPGGTVEVEAALHGTLGAAVITGLVTASRLALAFYERPDGASFAQSHSSPVIALTDVAVLARYDRDQLVWHRLAAKAYGGSLGGEGRLGRRGAAIGLRAALALRDVSAGDVPIDATGRPLADLASGRLDVDLRFDREGASPAARATAEGALHLEDGHFPVLLRAQAPLAKYGLGLPSQSASRPSTCRIALHDRGWTFADVVAAVPGCATTGRVDVALDGTVDGALVVRLGQELLEKSKLTLFPSLLAGKLTVPVRITGMAARPDVDADLAACFGTLLSDAAGGVAALFTGSKPPPPLGADNASPRALVPDPYGAAARGDAAAEDALVRALVAAGAPWDVIDARVATHRRGG